MIEQINKEIYALEEGEMTKVTPEIQVLSEQIPGEGLEYLANVCLFIGEHYQIPKEKPNRMGRTAHDILFPKEIPEECRAGLQPGKLPIGTCTEHGKVFRALCIAKGIPAIYIDTVAEDWINVSDDDMKDPDTYSGHVFVDVLVDNVWLTINPMADLKKYPKEWARGREEPQEYTIGGRVYRVFATGLDHKSLQTPDGRQLSFSSTVEWHKFVNHEFQERIEKLDQLPQHY
ncbi:MAG: transglutaminase domain-containing protein [Patescibacteria group bacterium]|nr:transglutaminase domain-containing protein [Patescibacteria group bacterium]